MMMMMLMTMYMMVMMMMTFIDVSVLHALGEKSHLGQNPVKER